MILTLVLISMFALNVRGDILSYKVHLDGPTEGTVSPGLGDGQIDYNNVTHMLFIGFSFSGLLSPTTASHIHAATTSPFTGTAGVATTTPYFAGFPIGVTSGSYTNTLDLTLAGSWNASYVTANGGTFASAEAALASAMASGRAYLNLHSQQFGGGEIRGFLVAIPEPSTAAVAGLGRLLLARLIRQRKLGR